ncbi:MAG: peptidylprolyl isomerase, partial [Paludibacteraceae bacterium]
MQRRVFVGENGQFSHVALMQFYNGVFNNPKAENEETLQQLQEYKSYWLFWEKAVKNSILQEKYTALLAKSIGSNNIEAKYNFDARKETGDVNYVVQPYFSVPDANINVTDTELKARYEQDKELFKQETNRAINYVAFEVAPLPEDFEEDEWMKKVSEEFKTTTDVEGLVNTEWDINYTGQDYSMQTVPANLKAFAFSNPTGAFFGPVFQNNTYTMAKIMQAGIMESDSAKLSHIVVSNEKTADSLMTVLNSSNFAEMAKKHSLAQQTAVKGGDVGWVNIRSVGKEITDQIVSKGVRRYFEVGAPQGVQIFEITEKSPARPKVKLAILERKVIPSDQSQAKIFNKAKQFAAENSDAENFEKNAKAAGYVVHPTTNLLESADNINMIPQSRQVVRWAFKHEKGEVSDVIE